MGTATQKPGGPLLNTVIPPGMEYDATANMWTVFGSMNFLGAFLANTQIVTDTTMLGSNDFVVVCNKGSAMDLDLGPAASNAGALYVIFNKGAGTVTVDPSGSEAIGNSTSLSLVQWASAVIFCDGVQWLVLLGA